MRREALEAGLRREGFIRKGVEIDPEELLAFLTPLVEPLLEEEFTFSREWLRGAAAPIQDPRRPQFLVGLKLNLPPEYLLIHRVWLGGIGVLSQIGGTVPLREMVCAHLPGIDESRLPPPPATEPARSPPGGVELALDAAQVACGCRCRRSTRRGRSRRRAPR